VRRDLERLAVAGRIVRVHGGAKMPDAVASGLTGVPFHENIKKHAAAKAAIGKAAAALCSAGESIIIDGGSTTLQMCPHLQGLELQVVTNSCTSSPRCCPSSKLGCTSLQARCSANRTSSSPPSTTMARATTRPRRCSSAPPPWGPKA